MPEGLVDDKKESKSITKSGSPAWRESPAKADQSNIDESNNTQTNKVW
jgi:hypothetical protein